MGFRSSASFGRRQEYVAVAELLRRGYDVYMTLVDDMGIDCVVRQGPDRFFDVQIKARSGTCNPKNAGHFPTLQIDAPRENYIFIFYSEQAGCHWVIPASKLAEPGFCNQIKSGPNCGCYRIMLTNVNSVGEVTCRPKFRQYINAFEAACGPPPMRSTD